MVAGCKTFKSIGSLERQCESFTLKRGCPTQLRLHIFIILTEVLILLFIVRRTCILKGDPMFDLHIFVVYHVIPGKWMISCREQKTGVEYKTGDSLRNQNDVPKLLATSTCLPDLCICKLAKTYVKCC